ncbi:MAG: hydrolase [Candidatus Bathyarchaeota archaeon]|nr:hydrolase [Candidatus Bathyarchaeota archaeon]
MPFTPFHLGPALALGLPTRKYIHAPTFIIANVIVDVEPLVVLFLGSRYPLHGYLHTFLLASLIGLIFGYVMSSAERFFQPLFKMLFLETGDKLKLKSFVLAGALGTILHVLLDSPLYTDIQPFYPVIANLLYNPALSSEIYNLCVWLGIVGIAYYAGLLILSTYKKLMRKD